MCEAYISLGCVVDKRHELREDETLEEEHFNAVAVLHDAFREATTVLDLVDSLAHVVEHVQNRVTMFVVYVLQFGHDHVLQTISHLINLISLRGVYDCIHQRFYHKATFYLLLI